MSNVFLDYLSFTWCPDELAGIRRLAAAGNQNFAKFLENREKSNPVIDIDFLESDCVEHVMTFCMVTCKDVFKGCDFSTEDLWEETFDMRPRVKGMFGYRKSWDLYINKQPIGVAACGAKNGGCYISFTGSGCSLLDMSKVYKQIRDLPLIKITRTDPAFDDYQGIYSVDHAFDQWKQGGFTLNGRAPKCQWIMSGGELGSDGEVEYNGGRTFTVGNRANGKMCRIYEKGKQMGRVDSNWTRWEVELRSTDREIPLDILLRPEDYLIGAYPCLSFVQMYQPVEQPTRIKTKKKQIKTAYENSVVYARRNVGRLINVMRDSKGLSDSEIVAQLSSLDPYSVPLKLQRALGAHIPES